ncbi:hypothetical protein M3580_16235 [Bacillus safensis]|uniref:hypothetical protein n=1 Tax=Bacillus safensis TaxID=561879 RepID=UPI00203A6194|nr:hypothetical protein [Bacillus safensis]MCM2990746.1 hypothetical protein [Bacillus safensis]
MNKNQKTKIETLKRKSRRKHLMNELSYMPLPEQPFLDIEGNQLFCQKVFERTEYFCELSTRGL